LGPSLTIGVRREAVLAERLGLAARRGLGRLSAGVLPLGRHTRLLHHLRPCQVRPGRGHRLVGSETVTIGHRLGWPSRGGNRAQPYRSLRMVGIPVYIRRGRGRPRKLGQNSADRAGPRRRRRRRPARLRSSGRTGEPTGAGRPERHGHRSGRCASHGRARSRGRHGETTTARPVGPGGPS
jgi:hypothetical protein